MPGDVFDNQFPTQAEKDMYHVVKKKKLEERETEEEAKEIGYKHENTLKMELSSISGKGIKYEPIFIFKK